MTPKAYDIDGRMRQRMLEFVRGHPRSAELLVLPSIASASVANDIGVSWNDYVGALNELVAVLGEDEVVEGMVVDAFGSADFALVLEGLSTLATPEQMYRFFMGIGGRLNPGVSSSLEQIGPGVLCIRLAQPRPDGVVSTAYFRTTQRVFELLPARLLGTREAVVELTTDGRSGTFVVQLPPARTVWARLRNMWHALLGHGPMADLVFEEQVRARAHMLELQRMSDELDSRVEARTLELAGLNDRLRAASANKSRHLADMSHELRTPLNAIIGYAEMLAEDAALADEQTVADDLQRIDTAAHYLLKLIGNVLDISKIEAGRLEIVLRDEALEPIVSSTVDSLMSVLEAGGNVVEVELRSVHARVDSMRVQQILANLLGNAAKFCREGRIRVVLRVEEGEAVIEVCDTGCGLDDAALGRVFEPYQQVVTTSSAPFRGTGLGLPISRELAHLMGGTLTAVSTPGEGSTFQLRIPGGHI